MAERSEEKDKIEISPITEGDERGGEFRPRKSEKTTILDWIRPRENREREFVVDDWLTRIEKDPQQTKNQQIGKTASPLQAVADKAEDVFEIPIGRDRFVSGLRKSVDEVARWLSVFFLRIVKKKNGKVKFKEENDAS